MACPMPHVRRCPMSHGAVLCPRPMSCVPGQGPLVLAILCVRGKFWSTPYYCTARRSQPESRGYGRASSAMPYCTHRSVASALFLGMLSQCELSQASSTANTRPRNTRACGLVPQGHGMERRSRDLAAASQSQVRSLDSKLELEDTLSFYTRFIPHAARLVHFCFWKVHRTY